MLGKALHPLLVVERAALLLLALAGLLGLQVAAPNDESIPGLGAHPSTEQQTSTPSRRCVIRRGVWGG